MGDPSSFRHFSNCQVGIECLAGMLGLLLSSDLVKGKFNLRLSKPTGQNHSDTKRATRLQNNLLPLTSRFHLSFTGDSSPQFKVIVHF